MYTPSAGERKNANMFKTGVLVSGKISIYYTLLLYFTADRAHLP